MATTPHRKPPSFRLHKGSGQAFVQLKGRRYYLGRYDTLESRERYQRFLTEYWVRPTLPPASSGASQADLLIVELAAAYWQFAEGYYRKDGKPSSTLSHIRLVLRLLRSSLGTTPAAEFGPCRLKAFRNQLIHLGHSRTYVNKLTALVVRVFKWGASEELIPSGVYHDLRTVEGLRRGRTTAPERPPIPPVSDAVVNATMPFLPPMVGDMVKFQRHTGCRPGEVCSIRPCDVDRNADMWEYRPAGHKTEHLGRDRVIFVGPKAQEVLRPYLLRPADAFCFSPAESEAKRKAEMRARRKTPVQPSQVDRRKRRPKRTPQGHYSRYSYAKAVHRAVDRANKDRGEDPLPHWHPNQLRHSAGTEIRKLFGLEAAQVALGHSRADVTQVYAERDMKLAAEIARKIG